MTPLTLFLPSAFFAANLLWHHLYFSFRQEVNTISAIAYKNNIKLDLNRLIHHAQLSRIHSLSSSFTPTLCLKKKVDSSTVPRTCFAQNCPHPQEYRYHSAFYPAHTLRHTTSVKDLAPLMAKTGVYKITCGACGAFYVGQTGRSLDQRIKEHLDAFNKEDLLNTWSTLFMIRWRLTPC